MHGCCRRDVAAHNRPEPPHTQAARDLAHVRSLFKSDAALLRTSCAQLARACVKEADAGRSVLRAPRRRGT